MFNWEKFKEGKIAVHCDTKEKAIDFLNECERHLIERAKINIGRLDYCIFEDGIGYSCGIDYNKLESDSLEYYEKEYETIIKWNIKENNMEKTFREVIADIKEGEVWVNEIAPINFIRLREDGVLDFNENEGINLNVKYKLQRKQYTFEEAFKAYEEGKEIENILTGLKIKASVREGWNMLPIINGKLEDDVFSKTLSIEEVRTKWYINN